MSWQSCLIVHFNCTLLFTALSASHTEVCEQETQLVVDCKVCVHSIPVLQSLAASRINQEGFLPGTLPLCLDIRQLLMGEGWVDQQEPELQALKAVAQYTKYMYRVLKWVASKVIMSHREASNSCVLNNANKSGKH